MRPSKDAAKSQPIESYNYPAAQTPLRPDAGVQAQWKKKKAPQTYRYDPSLAPELSWDGQNAAREAGEALIRRIIEAESLEEAQAAAEKLKELSRPFLNWAGKAERLSFDVPTLPLFVHERLSTEAIIQTLRGHKRSDQLSMLDLYGDPRRPVADQVLRPYEFGDWTNRLVLGDSLVVMNSLLHYESLGGKVQMIYIDPPYGVKFGSNFQPFVRKRDVSSGDDDDMTREPEMVQAYRDTWELGLHSYLTYLRDRLLLARDLLHPSGSVFVQISDDNLHHVREVMDEVFGGENFVCVISVQKTGGLSQSVLPVTADFLLWYAKDRSRLKFNPLYLPKSQGEGSGYQYVELSNGQRRRMSPEERDDLTILPVGSRIFQPTSLESANPTFEFEYCGKKYIQRWKTNRAGLARLAQANRLYQSAKTLRYVRYVDDFPVVSLTNVWTDTGAGSFLEAQLYVVQTVTKIVARCVLM
ncbi:MAG: hypothetical protein JOZ57_00470, partial [Abitibacteriaceae bacterium]|nr:hypothetical protein [Abditibacteriaceae bacterium]